MKINQIALNNFGSYEGENVFETRVKPNKNIVLIGGKNGAGKTSLFTAIRLCLYGYMSLGYKSINSFYNRSIIKLINNTAKLKKPAQASILLKHKVQLPGPAVNRRAPLFLLLLYPTPPSLSTARKNLKKFFLPLQYSRISCDYIYERPFKEGCPRGGYAHHRPI